MPSWFSSRATATACSSWNEGSRPETTRSPVTVPVALSKVPSIQMTVAKRCFAPKVRSAASAVTSLTAEAGL